MAEKQFNLLGMLPNGVTMCRFEDVTKQHRIVLMQKLTKEQEEQIDNSGSDSSKMYFDHPKYGLIFARDIYLYGEVDLNNQDDLDSIDKFNLVNERHNIIPSDYNFETGDIFTENGIVKRYDTTNPIKWFKYQYCRLGKPKRIIIFKVPLMRKQYGKS